MYSVVLNLAPVGTSPFFESANGAQRPLVEWTAAILSLLFSLARNAVRDHPSLDADDLAHDSLLRLLQGESGKTPRPLAYYQAYAVNVFRRTLQERLRRERETTGPPLEDRLEAMLRRAAAGEALESLMTPQQREREALRRASIIAATHLPLNGDAEMVWQETSPDGRLTAVLRTRPGDPGSAELHISADNVLANQPIRVAVIGGGTEPAGKVLLGRLQAVDSRATVTFDLDLVALRAHLGEECTQIEVLPVSEDDLRPEESGELALRYPESFAVEPTCFLNETEAVGVRPSATSSTLSGNERLALWAFRERLENDSSACVRFVRLSLDERRALVARLRAIADTMRRSGKGFLQADESFHVTIAELAGEDYARFTRWACRLIFLSQYGGLARDTDTYPEIEIPLATRLAVCEEHDAIVAAFEDAINGRDVDRVFRAIHRHLQEAQERWFPGLRVRIAEENAAYFRRLTPRGGLLFASLNLTPIEWRSAPTDPVFLAAIDAVHQGSELWYLHPSPEVIDRWQTRLNRELMSEEEWRVAFTGFQDAVTESIAKRADAAAAVTARERIVRLTIDQDLLFGVLRPDCTHGYFCHDGHHGQMTERLSLRPGAAWDGIETGRSGSLSAETFLDVVRNAIEEQLRQTNEADLAAVLHRCQHRWFTDAAWTCLGSACVIQRKT